MQSKQHVLIGLKFALIRNVFTNLQFTTSGRGLRFESFVHEKTRFIQPNNTSVSTNL